MRYRNAEAALVGLAHRLQAVGSEVVVRGATSTELRNVQVTLTHPLERGIGTPGRHNDPFACIAETVWVLAGRDDLAFLSHYLPRAADFSDDGGKTWRGAYGPRLRNWAGVDQLKEIVQLLKDDPTTRRAVMTIFDPARDHTASRDVPCTNWLGFSIRDGALDMAVTVRSNDLVWGFSGINTFEWSVLQEAVAYWTGSRVGTVTYFINSLHVYKRHERRLESIIQLAPAARMSQPEPATTFATAISDLSETLDRWFVLENHIRSGRIDEQAVAAFSDPMLRDFLWMLIAYWRREGESEGDGAAAIAHVASPSLRRAASAWLDWQNAAEPEDASAVLPSRLLVAIQNMHAAKDNIYGDSWKRRGEQISILANIARKIDRLSIADLNSAAAVEPLFDTAADLYTYAVKYETFLSDAVGAPPPAGAATWSDGTDGFDALAPQSESDASPKDRNVAAAFAAIERSVNDDDPPVRRASLARTLSTRAYGLVCYVASLRPVETRTFLTEWHDAQREAK